MLFMVVYEQVVDTTSMTPEQTEAAMRQHATTSKPNITTNSTAPSATVQQSNTSSSSNSGNSDAAVKAAAAAKVKAKLAAAAADAEFEQLMQAADSDLHSVHNTADVESEHDLLQQLAGALGGFGDLLKNPVTAASATAGTTAAAPAVAKTVVKAQPSVAAAAKPAAATAASGAVPHVTARSSAASASVCANTKQQQQQQQLSDTPLMVAKSTTLRLPNLECTVETTATGVLVRVPLTQVRIALPIDASYTTRCALAWCGGALTTRRVRAVCSTEHIW
jgi:hypothetical protein